MKELRTGGGWAAVRYALQTARRTGGFFKFLNSLRSRNACKTCALGMGGQLGGMVDESGHFPEICKKSMQAMAADMQGRIESPFWSTYNFDQLRQFTPRELEHMGRLVEPVYAGPGDKHYRPISWGEAVSRSGTHLKKTSPEQNFFYASGRSSNEAGFLLHLFARLYGTNNVNNCSYYCHQASGVGLTSVLGSGTGTVMLEDLDRCDLVFLIGANPASNHPRLMRALMNLRRRGGQVIVINPIRELGLVNFSVPSDVRSLFFGSDIASQYIQPHIGGDIALLTGIAKRVEELGAVEEGFVTAATDGADDFRRSLHEVSWGDIERCSGVDRATIERAAKSYAESNHVIFAWTMGITHHVHGVNNVRAIANLALLRGMVGKSGAGLMPIRGHSNVQGIGSVGVTPKLRQAIFDRIEKQFNVTLPTTPGVDTLSCMEAMHQDKLKNAWCLGGNLFGSNPDAKWTRDAIAKLDSMTYLSTTLNTGHAWGRAKETLILPVLPRDEEEQATTQESMFSYVRMSDGGPRRLDGPRSEVEIIIDMASGVLGANGPVDWESLREHRNIRQMIAAVVPGFEELDEIDHSKREFQIPGRTFHEPKFATPTGRAKMHAVRIPAMELPPDALRLMTIRSEGQFNTVVYEDHDLYRGQDRRDIIMMNARDIERLGFQVDQRVSVQSAAGTMRGIVVREIDIREGNAAMYCPEANVLVPRAADPESRTPAFKSVMVTLVAEAPRGFVQIAPLQKQEADYKIESKTESTTPRRPLRAC